MKNIFIKSVVLSGVMLAMLLMLGVSNVFAGKKPLPPIPVCEYVIPPACYVWVGTDQSGCGGHLEPIPDCTLEDL